MKKKVLLIAVLGVLIGIVSIIMITHTNELGSMRQSFDEPETSRSTISFEGKEGEKIRFSFRSNVEGGNLDMNLYDSDGNMVYQLSKARELDTNYVLEDTDTYTLAAERENFTGNYKIKVTK